MLTNILMMFTMYRAYCLSLLSITTIHNIIHSTAETDENNFNSIIFCHNTKYWTNLNVDLMMVLKVKSWNHQRFNFYSSNSPIFLKTTNVKLVVALEEKSGDHQSH